MKLPSGREISVESLLDAAQMLGENSFYYDSVGEAEEEIYDQLSDPCLKLSGTERPFGDDDLEAVICVIKPAACKISNELYDALEKMKPLAKILIQAEVANYEQRRPQG